MFPNNVSHPQVNNQENILPRSLNIADLHIDGKNIDKKMDAYIKFLLKKADMQQIYI